MAAGTLSLAAVTYLSLREMRGAALRSVTTKSTTHSKG